MTEGRKRAVGRLYVLLVGAAVSALAWFWRFDAPPPEIVDSLAAAAGLRPPTGPLALLWQHIAGPLCRSFGLGTAQTVLRTAGHVSLGILAVLSALLFEMLLPSSLIRGAHLATWWRRSVWFVLVQGVVLFCCADPVWNAFRWFSPLSLQVLLAALAAVFLVAHFRFGGRSALFASFLVLGFLAADTPIGAVFLSLAVAALGVRRLLRNAGHLETPEETPFAAALMPWRITLVFLSGLAAGIALEVDAFARLDGPLAFGWTWGDYAVEAPIAYVRALLASCTPAGLAIMVALTVFPVVLEAELLSRASDDERHLVYVYGASFAVLGFVAFSQLSPAKSLWFWTKGGGAGCVTDGVIRCAALLLCALSVAWALAVFVIELYLRNFRRIETLRYPDAAEAKDAAPALASARRLQRITRAVFLLEPVLVLGCVVPGRAQRLERDMQSVVADAAIETAEECRDVDFLFTDGGLDAGVELAAKLAGRRLRTLSMMGRADSARDVDLRTRGVENAADGVLLESGAADALRTWVRMYPETSRTYAVQIGFELWRRDGRPMPDCSGLVARPEGFSAEEMERGAAAARALAGRMLQLYGEGSPGSITDVALRDAFLFVQWRLAVIARHRANAYDEGGKAELAMEETRLADALDSKNGALARIRSTMSWASRRKLERMTPQEGLRLALARADFARARTYALRVVDATPDDPSANFALGMDFFVQKQYARAEAYLSRCLVRRPDDPAVLNNLAQCRLRQGDPKGALPYAKRALETLPDSPEVKRTMERIQAALK